MRRCSCVMPRCSCVMPRPQRHHGSCSGEAAGAGGRAQSRAGGRAAGARGRGSAAAAVASVLLRAGGLADLGGGLKLSSAEPASCCGGQLRRAAAAGRLSAFPACAHTGTPAMAAPGRRPWQLCLEVSLSAAVPSAGPFTRLRGALGLWLCVLRAGRRSPISRRRKHPAAAASTLPPPQGFVPRRKAAPQGSRCLGEERRALAYRAGLSA